MAVMMAARSVSTDIVRRGARQRRITRDLIYRRLYPIPPAPAGPDDPLRNLANTFSRYASTQATAFDSGAARATSGGAGNLLERQVERAFAQVLGRSPGRSAESFFSALNDAFPLAGNGQVQGSPARSVVSLTSPIGNNVVPAQSGTTAAGLAGQISAEQATLYRETQVVGQDAINVLAGLQSFAPEAEADRVEALRALVRSEIGVLMDEFGRLDEPRPDRVESYLDALTGPNGHLTLFGQRALLDGSIVAATAVDEQQIAGFNLLRNYADLLRQTWRRYNAKKQATVQAYPVFTERLSRASVLMPVIAEGNSNLMSAMDSIGFSENERRSNAANFLTLGSGAPALPNMTVNDLNEWIERFGSQEGPEALRDQYGLEFATGQADRLFTVMARILAHVKSTAVTNLNSLPVIAQVLVHERVSWALDDLFNQLRALADLAA